MSGMNDTPETLPRRRRASRKRNAPAVAPPEPAVQAILDQALHPDPEVVEAPAFDPPPAAEPAVAPGKPARKPRASRKRKTQAAAPAVVAVVVATECAADLPADAATETAAPHDEPVEVVAEAPALDTPVADSDAPPLAAWEVAERAAASSSSFDGYAADPDTRHDADAPSDHKGHEHAFDGHGADAHEHDHNHDGHAHDEHAHDEHAHDEHAPAEHGTHAPPPSGGGAAPHPAAHGAGHYWVYVAFAVFLLALAFGAWGVWTTFFVSDDGHSAAALRTRAERLSQEVSTLRRSDQISRDANRDLERTLAERDEEIAGLRADVAFYESFVGATGQRHGLAVHDLQMQLQGGDAWHFVATLTQNLNRGAINSGRLTMTIEGTRNDRLERLAWASLRKQSNAPGVDYSFKYFQQVEGEVMLPAGFKPLRVTVHAVPAGGNAVEQSFPWPDAIRPHNAAAR